jgi:hypothetical protein
VTAAVPSPITLAGKSSTGSRSSAKISSATQISGNSSTVSRSSLSLSTLVSLVSNSSTNSRSTCDITIIEADIVNIEGVSSTSSRSNALIKSLINIEGGSYTTNRSDTNITSIINIGGKTSTNSSSNISISTTIYLDGKTTTDNRSIASLLSLVGIAGKTTTNSRSDTTLFSNIGISGISQTGNRSIVTITISECNWEVIDDNVDPLLREFSDTDVLPETTYRYRIRAINDVGVSEWSNIDEATTPAEEIEEVLKSLIFNMGQSQGIYTEEKVLLDSRAGLLLLKDQILGHESHTEKASEIGFSSLLSIYKDSEYSISGVDGRVFGQVSVFDGISKQLVGQTLSKEYLQGVIYANLQDIFEEIWDEVFEDVWKTRADSLSLSNTQSLFSPQKFNISNLGVEAQYVIVDQPFVFDFLSKFMSENEYGFDNSSLLKEGQNLLISNIQQVAQTHTHNFDSFQHLSVSPTFNIANLLELVSSQKINTDNQGIPIYAFLKDNTFTFDILSQVAQSLGYSISNVLVLSPKNLSYNIDNPQGIYFNQNINFDNIGKISKSQTLDIENLMGLFTRQTFNITNEGIPIYSLSKDNTFVLDFISQVATLSKIGLDHSLNLSPKTLQYSFDNLQKIYANNGVDFSNLQKTFRSQSLNIQNLMSVLDNHTFAIDNEGVPIYVVLSGQDFNFDWTAIVISNQMFSPSNISHLAIQNPYNIDNLSKIQKSHTLPISSKFGIKDLNPFNLDNLQSIDSRNNINFAQRCIIFEEKPFNFANTQQVGQTLELPFSTFSSVSTNYLINLNNLRRFGVLQGFNLEWGGLVILYHILKDNEFAIEWWLRPDLADWWWTIPDRNIQWTIPDRNIQWTIPERIIEWNVRRT